MTKCYTYICVVYKSFLSSVESFKIEKAYNILPTVAYWKYFSPVGMAAATNEKYNVKRSEIFLCSKNHAGIGFIDGGEINLGRIRMHIK